MTFSNLSTEDLTMWKVQLTGTINFNDFDETTNEENIVSNLTQLCRLELSSEGGFTTKTDFTKDEKKEAFLSHIRMHQDACKDINGQPAELGGVFNFNSTDSFIEKAATLTQKKDIETLGKILVKHGAIYNKKDHTHTLSFPPHTKQNQMEVKDFMTKMTKQSAEIANFNRTIKSLDKSILSVLKEEITKLTDFPLIFNENTNQVELTPLAFIRDSDALKNALDSALKEAKRVKYAPPETQQKRSGLQTLATIIVKKKTIITKLLTKFREQH